jgi:hypothetical protein
VDHFDQYRESCSIARAGRKLSSSFNSSVVGTSERSWLRQAVQGAAGRRRRAPAGVAVIPIFSLGATRKLLPASPVFYGQCWPGMILQGQLLSPSQEAVNSLDK